MPTPLDDPRSHFRPAEPLAALRRRADASRRRGHGRRGAGVELLALTDHDTVDGVPQAASTAALVAYLIEGRPAFRPRAAPSVPESLAAIHDAGGVVVWAHPLWDAAEPQQVLATMDRFRSLGLDGVECFYPTHTREQTELIADRCAQLGLLSTGSSDFHGPRHRTFSRFRTFSTYGREPALGRIAS